MEDYLSLDDYIDHIEQLVHSVNSLPILPIPATKTELASAIPKGAVGVVIYYRDSMNPAFVSTPKHVRKELRKSAYKFYSFLPCPTPGQAHDVKLFLDDWLQ